MTDEEMEQARMHAVRTALGYTKTLPKIHCQFDPERHYMTTVPPDNPINTAAWTHKPKFVEFPGVGNSESFYFIRLSSITCIQKDYQEGTTIYTTEGTYQVKMSYDEVKSILLNSGE